MTTALWLIAGIILYGIWKLGFTLVWCAVEATLKRRKIAKMDRLDSLDGSKRLRNHYLQLQEIKQAILNR
jgi:hypothetical protein